VRHAIVNSAIILVRAYLYRPTLN